MDRTTAVLYRRAALLRWICALVVAAAASWPASAEPIDRKALVDRHRIVLDRIDPHAPLMLGNGSLGFTADITGLQTFPERYSNLAPLLTMAQWSWHAFPNPSGFTESSGLVQVPTPRGPQPYAWMRSWSEAETNPAFTWLRANPHRFSLGRLSLVLRRADGRPAAFEDVAQPRQTLDLWSGALHSRFVFEGRPVEIETRVHPSQDAVLVEIRSSLVRDGRLGVAVRFPYVTDAVNGDPSDWTRPDRHRTLVARRARDRVDLVRTLDATTYHAAFAAPGAQVRAAGPHAFEARSEGGDRLVVVAAFGRAPVTASVDYEAARRQVETHWRRYWSEGGVVDFSGSTDPRAPELERRVVLSQYLMAVNAAGELPPQEEGLFSNSWYGKFHLEMHPWHAAHFAAWGRPQLLERSLGWYLSHLPAARAEAARHGVTGAWWPKMTGPEGRNSPSTINPFIMWQQPHPIFLAELVWRAKGDRATLERYAPLVEETAGLLASWPVWEEARRTYALGPPVIPVQENHPPLATRNPAFELEYFRWGLATAQAWRERLGLPRKAQWDEVIMRLPPPTLDSGLYLPAETTPDFWRQAAAQPCRGHAEGDCLNRDHPSMLMAYGFIRGARVDPEAMRRTLRAVERDWDLRQTWGWDFPMAAMTAARLGEPDAAVNWLFLGQKNTQWGVSGMTPRVHLEAHAETFTPGVGRAEGPDGPGYRRAAETYFPSNGALLLAVGMMAAGWDGSQGQAPGFPTQGWKVRAEGIRPLP